MTQQSEQPFDHQRFAALPVVGILRGESPDICHRVAEVYLECGFSTLEVTMNTPEVTDIIAGLREAYPTLNVGAGTVCTLAGLERVAAAGAQFVVTPVMTEEVIMACVERDLPVFPGAYTPTEIYRAWSLGASAVKIFPATQLGPQYVKDVLAPLNEIKLLPTGGISQNNMFDYFRAGAVGVGMSSGLFPKAIIVAEDYQGLAQHFDRIRSGYREMTAG